MEEKYKQVTEIIMSLAKGNPYITTSQIARAKSMYNGDTRPLEVIQKELEAYSEQIMAQAKKAHVIKPEMSKEVPQETKALIEQSYTSSNIEPKIEETKIYEPLQNILPINEKNAELESMFNGEFDNNPNSLEKEESYNASNVASISQAKVLTKSTSQPYNNISTANESGHGSAMGLLSLVIIFSILTIVISCITILLR